MKNSQFFKVMGFALLFVLGIAVFQSCETNDTLPQTDHITHQLRIDGVDDGFSEEGGEPIPFVSPMGEFIFETEQDLRDFLADIDEPYAAEILNALDQIAYEREFALSNGYDLLDDDDPVLIEYNEYLIATYGDDTKSVGHGMKPPSGKEKIVAGGFLFNGTGCTGNTIGYVGFPRHRFGSMNNQASSLCGIGGWLVMYDRTWWRNFLGVTAGVGLIHPDFSNFAGRNINNRISSTW